MSFLSLNENYVTTTGTRALQLKKKTKIGASVKISCVEEPYKNLHKTIV